MNSSAVTKFSIVIPATELPEEVECLGLRGEGYQEYAWQTGDSFTGGVAPTAWIRISRVLFPYKHWAKSSSDELSAGESDEDTLPEKAVHSACQLSTAVQLAIAGEPVETNNLTHRPQWTNYEKKRLHQSLLIAARWTIHASSGSVFAKRCQGITTNLNHTCSPCIEVGCLDGLKRGIRRARAWSKLPLDQFTSKMKNKLAHTPTIRSENAAAAAKASLATPAVMKLLSSKAMYGPVGAFLSLFQQAQQGDLDDQASFVSICDQLTDKVRRQMDPSGHAIHGIRYDQHFGNLCALMRSYGPRSGAQYDLLCGITGAISPRQMR